MEYQTKAETLAGNKLLLSQKILNKARLSLKLSMNAEFKPAEN